MPRLQFIRLLRRVPSLAAAALCMPRKMMLTRWKLATVAILSCLGLVIGIFMIAAARPTQAAAAAPAKPSHLWITALGDSVASGEGSNYRWHYDAAKGKWIADNHYPTWAFSTVGGQRCHVSAEGYPVKVAANLATLRGVRPGSNLNNFTCSGASADQGVLGVQTGTATIPQLGTNLPGFAPPNVEYTDPYPDVVTLTLGADDIHFADVIKKCYGTLFSVGPCDLNRSLRKTLDADLAKEKIELDRVLDEITNRHAAGGKPPFIVVTTYYDPFPDHYPKKLCADLNPIIKPYNISAGELAFLKLYLLKLNDNIRSVVRHHTANTKLVDIESLVKDRNQWCGKDPWVYGPSIASPFYYPGNQSPFHPTPYAQTVIANKVTAAIKAHFKL